MLVYGFLSKTQDLKKSLSSLKVDLNLYLSSLEVLMKLSWNTSLAAPGALANRLQRRTARKANEANLDPPNQKSEITSL